MALVLEGRLKGAIEEEEGEKALKTLGKVYLSIEGSRGCSNG